MKVYPTRLPGVYFIEPRVFTDARGFFMETWQAERYQQAPIPRPFVQDNYSYSTWGVLRGLHSHMKMTALHHLGYMAKASGRGRRPYVAVTRSM